MNNQEIKEISLLMKWRMSLGLSKRKLSMKLGISPVRYWYYETGKVIPPLRIILKIASFYKLNGIEADYKILIDDLIKRIYPAILNDEQQKFLNDKTINLVVDKISAI